MGTPIVQVEKTYDIPTVSFRVITDDKSLLLPAGVHSEQARSYGYNDFSDFERPEHYIRYIEPIESELAVQVEYDMDEQDQEWLDAINAERKKDQSGPVSYEAFEIIMDKLEKEWFNLIKRIPQPVSHLPVEDSKCAICDDGEGENSNAIVFCDGCNLAVHQDCYGVPYIPEGQWLCRKCTVSPENPVSCLFCPNEGGAFKQTTTGHWSHLLCAIWIPELGVGNSIYMEPVEGVELVPKNRWKLICSLCKERVGACIQCVNKSCFTAFHVTCARQMGLLQSMKLMGDGQLESYCEKHLPLEWREGREDMSDANDTDYHDTEDDEEEEDVITPAPRKRARNNSTTARAVVTPKTARAHAKSYRPGPPIVPRMIINRLMEYIAKVSIRKRQPFIERLCRYWSLKREARRGAPLLKRLHLEPWTATSESREQTEAEKAKKLEFLVALRNDLEKVRLLAELVRKREKEKLRQAQVLSDIVDNFILPHFATLRTTLGKIVAMDRGELFLNPVTVEEAPDYFEVIKEPMSWSGIEAKLDKVEYRYIDEFKHDVLLVLNNATLYNKGETPFHRTAARMKKNVQPLLDELDNIRDESLLLPVSEGDEGLAVAEPGTVGDLETSLLRLKTLLSTDPTDDSRDMLGSIFAFEVEKAKTPTPVPPTPAAEAQQPQQPQQKSSRRRHQTAAEKAEYFEKQAAAYKERLSLGGSTRKSRAAAVTDGDVGGTPPPLESLPMPTPNRRRAARKDELADDEQGGEPSSAASSPGTIKPMQKPQRGVLGVLSVPVMSDRERRAREKDLELVTESVDPLDEYKRFNVGWILPEGSKRRRPPPPPLPLRKPSAPKASSSRGKAPSTEPSIQGTELSQTSKTSQAGTDEHHDRKARGRAESREDPDDAEKTPTESNKRKLSEEQDDVFKRPRPAPLADDSDDDILTPVPESAEPSAVAEKFSLPDRSSLSPLPDEQSSKEDSSEESLKEEPTEEPTEDPTEDPTEELTEEPTEEPTEKPTEKPTEEPEEHTKEEPEDETNDEPKKTTKRKRDDLYSPGSQVWAKITSYPYFPAIVVDHVGEWETVPQSVLDLEEHETETHGKVWLVRFYDKQRSYGWMAADKLDMLGTDDELDELYLAGKERGKKSSSKTFKSSHVKASCKKAYQIAKAALQGESGGSV